MIRSHQHVELVPCSRDHGGGAELGGGGGARRLEAGVDPRVLREVHGGFAGNGVVGGAAANFLRRCFWREEEDADAHIVGGPDHRLYVEGGPAIGCHAYKLRTN